MSTTSQINWRKIIPEILGIIFAVLLALSLESWREDMELQEKTEASLVRIRHEIAENRANLKEAIDDNHANINGINAAIEEGDFSIDTLGQYLQISAGSTSDSAWTSAKMTQVIVRMSPEMLEDLTSLYDTQNYYASYVRFFFQQYTDLTLSMQQDGDGGWSARKFLQHLKITNSLAEQVLEEYDEFIGPVEKAVSSDNVD